MRCLCFLEAPLMPAPPPAQAHADPVACAGKHRPFCIGRESGEKPQLTSRGMWVHSLVLKRFVWPSEHDLHWDPGAVSEFSKLAREH